MPNQQSRPLQDGNESRELKMKTENGECSSGGARDRYDYPPNLSTNLTRNNDHMAQMSNKIGSMDGETDDDEEYPRVKSLEPVQKQGNEEPAKLDGVGELLGVLRGEVLPPQKERIVLDELGFRDRDASKFPPCHIDEFQRSYHGPTDSNDVEIPAPNFPTDVRIVRKMIRQKMIRCKKCKNRFIEKNIYERHLRDKHPEQHEKYIQELRDEMEEQRLQELENNRIEELRTGGFIPPEKSAAEQVDDPNYVPLPGEENGGYPKMNYFERLRSMKRPYKKKASPQCPFCDKRFRNELSLSKHILKAHEEMSEFEQCLKCFKCVADKAALDAHNCELTYVCFECTPLRNMCSEPRLVRHRQKFHRGANSGFRCGDCNMKFLTPRKLRKHRKMVHVFTKTYSCHFCDEIFISEVGVMTHERIHTGIIRFECKVCDYTANRYTSMVNHQKDDHGYLCSVCQDAFAEQEEVAQHVYDGHGGYLASVEAGYIESPRTWLLYKGE